MNVTVDLINASTEMLLPAQDVFECWSEAAMEELTDKLPGAETANFELSIRMIDESESAALNHNFRQKSGSTNILSFPYNGFNHEGEATFLGDLAICAPVVKHEAEEQNKQLQAHWAHLTVHGILHLNAYNHENHSDAEVMETLETRILKTLGYSDPYQQVELTRKGQ